MAAMPTQIATHRPAARAVSNAPADLRLLERVPADLLPALADATGAVATELRPVESESIVTPGAPGDAPTPMLRGRSIECATADRMLAEVRAGESRVLVLRGEPGIGKTALLDYTVGAASGFRVLRVVAVASEAELAFGSLHQLCSPILDQLDRLPAPHRHALEVALGLREGLAPDRLLISVAALGLLAVEAAGRPLLCAVDNAQWLDGPSALTLAFIARRLCDERVAIVLASREPTEALSGLPEIVLDGVPDRDARLLLESGVIGRLDDRVRETIIAEARGNPLALLALPRALPPGALAGGFALPEAHPWTDSTMTETYRRRVHSLPHASRRLLLAAAAEPLGDAALLWRAASRLGVGPGALGPAESAALIQVGPRVRFRHPLVRAAIYRSATPDERRDVHRALADSTDAATDPDARAWHRAQAASGLDESVASELERVAHRAQARGGVAALAAFLERSAELTPDPARRGARALAAAQAKLDAGAPRAAYELLGSAQLNPLDQIQRARLQLLRTAVAFAQTRGSTAPSQLLDVARAVEPLDAALAHETCLEAFTAAVFAGRAGDHSGVVEVAGAVRGGLAVPVQPRPIDLLLHGLARWCSEPFPAAVPTLRQALSAFTAHDERADRGGPIGYLPRTLQPAAIELWDDAGSHSFARRAVRLARETGALAVLPAALTDRAWVHLHEGELDDASALVAEALTTSRATGLAPLPYAALPLLAWRGREPDALRTIESELRGAAARGEGRATGVAHYATAILYNGLGRYEDALAAAQRACAYKDLGLFGLALIELIEAAARTDSGASASDALRLLEERTQASGTDWALGVRACSMALLRDGRAAEPLYREAIQRLSRTRVAVHVARTRLVYGEWLRRENRRVDARQQLRAALDTFGRMGAEAFEERARRELAATGETVAKRTDQKRDVLTPQEAEIARLARDGLSNPEIAARLFLSPRTVQYHLRKVFQKLDLTSRNQLGRIPAHRLGWSPAVVSVGDGD